MSQQYTPVVWEDETTTQPGTLINKARLDQMQGAHHFADGFEEVDVVPTADPQVDYHKVVFCTADTTFYRWDGNQWTKDIDDETKALLLAHEADHSNPHVVTKAQVGLGNADNTSDLNKPISTATQTALDAKVAIIPVTSGVKFYSQSSGGTSLYQGTSSPVTGITSVPMRDSSGRIKTAAPSADDDASNKKYVDDADALKINSSALVSAWQGTPDNDHIPSEKLVKDSLGDGSVTKIGTATVGGDMKPVYLNAGVPTAVTNDLVDTATAQTIAGDKGFTNNAATTSSSATVKGYYGLGNIDMSASFPGNRYVFKDCLVDSNGSIIGGMRLQTTSAQDLIHSLVSTKTDGTRTLLEVWRYNRTNDAWIVKAPTPGDGAGSTEVATVGYIDAYAPMLRTTGNQTFAGTKTSENLQVFNSRPYIFQRVKDSGNWYKVYQYDNTNRRIIIMDVIWAHQSYNGYGVGRIVIPIIGSATTAKWLYRSGNASAFTADTVFVGLTNDGKTEIWVKGGYFVYTEIVRVIRGNVEDAITNTTNVYTGTAETIDLSNYTSYAYGSE